MRRGGAISGTCGSEGSERWYDWGDDGAGERGVSPTLLASTPCWLNGLYEGASTPASHNPSGPGFLFPVEFFKSINTLNDVEPRIPVHALSCCRAHHTQHKARPRSLHKTRQSLACLLPTHHVTL